MGHQVKAFAAKPDNPDPISGPHGGRRELSPTSCLLTTSPDLCHMCLPNNREKRDLLHSLLCEGTVSLILALGGGGQRQVDL